MPLEIGDTVRNIKLYNQNKELINLINDKTNFTVIAFLPGAFTQLCSIGINQIDSYIDDLNNEKVTLVGVSVDSPFTLASWGEQNNIRFDLLSDFKRECISELDVSFNDLGGIKGYITANRAIMIFNKSGTLIHKWVGEHPGNEPDYTKLLETIKLLEMN